MVEEANSPYTPKLFGVIYPRNCRYLFIRVLYLLNDKLVFTKGPKELILKKIQLNVCQEKSVDISPSVCTHALLIGIILGISWKIVC